MTTETLNLINPSSPKMKLEQWVNVYRRGEGYVIGATFDSKKEARRAVFRTDGSYVTTVPITIEFPTGE